MPRPDPEVVHETWLRACRADELLSRLDPPPDSLALVTAVLERLNTRSTPPNAVLAGLAAGLSAPQWAAAGEVVQRQIGRLMMAAAEAMSPHPDPRQVAEVHMEIGAAAAGLSLDSWRSRAELDPLTGLRNLIGQEALLELLTSQEDAFKVAQIDLDGLKAINDADGHDAGDDLIRRFGRVIRERVHAAGGTVCRPHGDEFVAALKVSEGDLDAVLADLQADCEIRFSWGSAEWPTDDPDVQTVLRKADKKMYEMKGKRGDSK